MIAIAFKIFIRFSCLLNIKSSHILDLSEKISETKLEKIQIPNLEKFIKVFNKKANVDFFSQLRFSYYWLQLRFF